jgi:integrase
MTIRKPEAITLTLSRKELRETVTHSQQEEFMGRSFYLYPRKTGVIYAEILDPQTGERVASRSTGTKNRDEAVLKVGQWLREGIPTRNRKTRRTAEAVGGLKGILRAIGKTGNLDADTALEIVRALRDRNLVDFPVVKAGKGGTDFIRFLETFWTYSRSPYVREKLAHKQSIGKRHCYDSMCRVRLYWKPAFKGRPLNSVTRQDLKSFSLSLADKGLASGTINKVMVCGTTALSWAFREGLISVDPTIGLIRFSGEGKKRGVLTPQEAAAVFAAEWGDQRAYAASLLSCTTGLRSGEVLALRRDDLADNFLYIRHSWSFADGLKTPKNGEERKVPLLPQVRKKLLELLGKNPHRVDNPFIFYGLLEDKPIDGKVLLRGFQAACRVAGIDPEARGIVFHSHRHFYAARMADKMTAEQISRITGHKSRAVFDEYADHVTDENLEAMGKAGAEVFSNIIPFSTKRGATA